MCGIAGWLCRRAPDAEERIRLAASLQHRGPDDDGFLEDPAAGLGLLHKRLSIIDLSAQGRQPMTNEDGSPKYERQRTGSHQERNPAYDAAVLAVTLAKSSAESAMRDVNRAIADARQVFSSSELAEVDANLIGMFDVLGQPHFGFWSYDQSDVADAQREVRAVIDQADRLGDGVRPERDRLQGEVEAAVDAKSAQLLA